MGSSKNSGGSFSALNEKSIATHIQKSDAGRPWKNGGPAPGVKIKTTRIVAS